MRKEVIEIFGDPIPKPLLELAKAVDAAITNAVNGVEEVESLRAYLKAAHDRIDVLTEERIDELYLLPRNVGSHNYPGISKDPTRLIRTSTCDYCNCWLGSSYSGGPDGIDPKGGCPNNPLLRESYGLLAQKFKELRLAIE